VWVYLRKRIALAGPHQSKTPRRPATPEEAAPLERGIVTSLRKAIKYGRAFSSCNSLSCTSGQESRASLRYGDSRSCKHSVAHIVAHTAAVKGFSAGKEVQPAQS